MPQTEKPLVEPVDLTQNAGINVVNLGADDVLQGRLEVQGDLKIAGKVEGELRATGNVTIDSSASLQASIEGSNVSVRGQVTGSVTARRLTLGGLKARAKMPDPQLQLDQLSWSAAGRRGPIDHGISRSAETTNTAMSAD